MLCVPAHSSYYIQVQLSVDLPPWHLAESLRRLLSLQQGPLSLRKSGTLFRTVSPQENSPPEVCYPRLVSIFLHGSEIKFGSGLTTKLNLPFDKKWEKTFKIFHGYFPWIVSTLPTTQCATARWWMGSGGGSCDVTWPPGRRRMSRPFTAWTSACSGKSENEKEESCTCSHVGGEKPFSPLMFAI